MNYKNQVNRYLEAKFIKAPIHSNKELRELIGVNLSQLRHLYIFSSKNSFKEAVNELINNNVKIDFKKANKTRR